MVQKKIMYVQNQQPQHNDNLKDHIYAYHRKEGVCLADQCVALVVRGDHVDASRRIRHAEEGSDAHYVHCPVHAILERVVGDREHEFLKSRHLSEEDFQLAIVPPPSVDCHANPSSAFE